MTELGEALLAVREKRCTFNDFVRATRIHWQRLSDDLRRRWDIPVWVGREDIEQDMLIAAWQFLDKFDPSRGVAIERFMVFNATDKAKKALHVARGANQHRGTDRNKSRYEKNESSFKREGDAEGERQSVLDQNASVEPDQEDVVHRNERGKRVLKACINTREFLTMQAITKVGNSVRDAASLLYEDRDARRICALTSIEQANEVVEIAVRDVAKRVRHLSL